MQETLFKDYRIESNNNNEIWLEISVDSLLKILKSADNSGALSGFPITHPCPHFGG